jgi:hypothetical protein
MRLVAALFLVCGLLVAGMVGATVNVTITESAGGIVATSDGTINSGVCTSVSGSFFFQNPSLQPNAGAVYFGDTNGSLTRCNTAVTPANIAFGTGGGFSGSLTPGGANWVIDGSVLGYIYVPAGFSSSTSFQSTATYSGTFSSRNITPGTYTYTLTNGGTTDTIVITVALAPTVTSISPSSGSTSGGDTITITGTYLTGATGITVGGAACSAFNVSSATSATCTTPAGTAGTASVVVTTPGGSNAANTLFTYIGVAAVPSLSEWAQLMLALMVIGVAWHFHNKGQNSY